MEAVPINPSLDAPHTEPGPPSPWGRALGANLEPESQSKPTGPPFPAPFGFPGISQKLGFVLPLLVTCDCDKCTFADIIQEF